MQGLLALGHSWLAPSELDGAGKERREEIEEALISYSTGLAPVLA
jgi:hypothetical protein